MDPMTFTGRNYHVTHVFEEDADYLHVQLFDEENKVADRDFNRFGTGKEMMDKWIDWFLTYGEVI